MVDHIHEGYQENIRELCEFKKKLDGGEHGIGELDRLWRYIEKKVTKGMMITFTFFTLSLVTVLFTLVYNSNHKVLHEMVGIKTSLQLINEKLK